MFALDYPDYFRFVLYSPQFSFFAWQHHSRRWIASRCACYFVLSRFERYFVPGNKRGRQPACNSTRLAEFFAFVVVACGVCALELICLSDYRTYLLAGTPCFHGVL